MVCVGLSTVQNAFLISLHGHESTPHIPCIIATHPQENEEKDNPNYTLLFLRLTLIPTEMRGHHKQCADKSHSWKNSISKEHRKTSIQGEKAFIYCPKTNLLIEVPYQEKEKRKNMKLTGNTIAFSLPIIKLTNNILFSPPISLIFIKQACCQHM